MKVLVTYYTQTGNTKKVAKAIYESINCDKELLDINKVKNFDYDLVFFGCPVQPPYPPDSIKKFLNRLKGTTALFLTHAAPESEPAVTQWIKSYKESIPGKVVATFNCQGKLSTLVKLFMLIAPDPKLREAARKDSSKGQPDESRLKKAAEWAKKIIKN